MVKIERIIILFLFVLLLLSFNVNAFGVSSPYWDENPLLMRAGETRDVVMSLQNMVGGEDVTVNAELDSGKEIAVLTDTDTIYKVPIGNSNTPIKLKITIPEDAKPGQEWQVGLSFKTNAPNTGGVGISSGISKGFKVKVIENPKTGGATTNPISLSLSGQTLGFLILVVILIILMLALKYFHKKRTGQ